MTPLHRVASSTREAAQREQPTQVAVVVGTITPAAKPALFRERALAARQRSPVTAEALSTAPLWTRSVVIATTFLVATTLAISVFARVEIVSVGHGILQANGSPQFLSTLVAGTVSAVSVHAGERVAPGQEIARLSSASTAASLLEAERKLELATTNLEEFQAHRKPLHLARVAYLRAQVSALSGRAWSNRKSVQRMTKKAKSVEKLRSEGLVTGFDSDDAKESVALAQRETFRVSEESARVHDQLTALEAELATEEWSLQTRIEEAKAQKDGLQFAVDAAVIKAPAAGIVGSISAHIGDAVAAGAIVGRLVPLGAPKTVVAYLPERDRAFIEPSSHVRIEVEQLPVWEFGALNGRVTRIAAEIASEHDLRDSFGDQTKSREPMYRVDVTIEEDAAYAALSQRLRAESLADVRFTLRRRRAITVLFQPFEKWLR
jgi:membrane fusion protein